MTLTVESIIGAMQEYVYEQLNDSPEPNEKKLATSKQQNPLEHELKSQQNPDQQTVIDNAEH